MTNFTVAVRVEATDGDAVLARIAESWGLTETEGVMSVTQQPDSVVVPPDMQPPPPEPPAEPPPDPPPPEP
jgi:hypothetical protein